MNKVSHDSASEQPGLKATSWLSGWVFSLFLGMTLFFAYMINGRELGSYDTISATLLPLCILRGDGIYFDNKHLGNVRSNQPLPDYLTFSHGRVVTLYPIAPALIAVPIFAPQVTLLDRYRPGWDRDRQVVLAESLSMAKRSMAVVVALAGVVLYRLLLALGVGRVALPTVLAACLGSDLWTVASQAPWQHGPAALSLVTVIALLHPPSVGRRRLALSGLFTALLVACRLMDVVFAVAIVTWLAWTDCRGLGWFLPVPILAGAALLSYNLWFFDTVLGGQTKLEQYHLKTHGVSDAWSGKLVDGFLGTLLSPNRGLLVFSPWIAVALVCLVVPTVRRRLAAHSLICVLIGTLIPYLIILSKYSVWWGGHCFGPRYWTDVVPLFAIVFAFGLDWMLARSRVLVAISAMAVIFSIAVQLIGAFCYPSSWNLQPRNVDLHHERLWDWRDTELSRCLIERFRTWSHVPDVSPPRGRDRSIYGRAALASEPANGTRLARRSPSQGCLCRRARCWTGTCAASSPRAIRCPSLRRAIWSSIQGLPIPPGSAPPCTACFCCPYHCCQMSRPAE